MGNCLKTQLKESVQNDNLRKLNTIIIDFVADENPSTNTRRLYIDVPLDQLVTLKVTSGEGRIFENVPGSSPSAPSSWTDHSAGIDQMLRRTQIRVFISNAPCRIEIMGYENATYLNVGNSGQMNIDDLYISTLTSIEGMFTKGNAKIISVWPTIMSSFNISMLSSDSIRHDAATYIVGKDIETIYLNGSLSTLSINEILTANTRLQGFNVPNSSINGSLADFLNNGQLKYPNLTRIAVLNTPNITKNAADVTTLRNLGVTVSGVD